MAHRRSVALSRSNPIVDHRRWRWQQRLAGAAVETRIAEAGQRARPRHRGQPPAAGHHQVEQNRAPALLLHQPELARPAARQHRVIVELISATTTQTGLTVRCELDTGQYPSGIVVSDAEMAAINIKRAEFHGEWNYTISPNDDLPNRALIL